MKILALSDEVVDHLYGPGLKDRYPEVDLVLGCGDLPYYYLEFVVTLLDVPLYYVPGNHDRAFQYLSDGRIISSAQGCESLDGEVARLPLRGAGPAPHDRDRLLLAGLGGSRRYNQDSTAQYTEGQMLRRALRLAPRLLANKVRYGRYLDILVTHASPRGIHDGADLAHTGFAAFCWLIETFRPRLLLHGHSHVYRGDLPTRTRHGATEVINVYPHRLIEWDPAHDRPELAARSG